MSFSDLVTFVVATLDVVKKFEHLQIIGLQISLLGERLEMNGELREEEKHADVAQSIVRNTQKAKIDMKMGEYKVFTMRLVRPKK